MMFVSHTPRVDDRLRLAPPGTFDAAASNFARMKHTGDNFVSYGI